MPPADCASCDIRLLADQFEKNSLRYATPIEYIIIFIDGKDLDGASASRMLAGAFLIVEVVPGGKILKPLKGAAKVATRGTRKIAITIGKTGKRFIGEVTDGVYKPFKWIKPDKVDEVLEVTDEVTYLAEDGVQRVGKLEVVRSGSEYGVRVLSNALKFTAKQIDDYVKLATKNVNAKKVMLGKYDEPGTLSYIERAGNDHTYFQLSVSAWNEAKSLVNNSLDEMWRINRQFIDEQKALGKEFFLSHEPWKERSTSFLSREAEYLEAISKIVK